MRLNHSQGTEKETGSRQKVLIFSAVQIPQLSFGWRCGFSFLFFHQLLASKGKETTSCFMDLSRKGRGRPFCPPGPQLHSKYGRKLITDRTNGGVAEQAGENIIQPYSYQLKICLELLPVSSSGQQQLSRKLYSFCGVSQNIHPAVTKWRSKVFPSRRWHLKIQ